ncbi:MAG TPA: hypothetical protein VKB49_14790 [Candidatus Sulfotelmatobacter sp.]|nr:hypothetical protein [Candidatus Sulfotelmatobacter sp.]
MAVANGNVANLTYDAASEVLSGTIGRDSFRMTAYSGGSRGHRAGVKPVLAAKYLHNEADTLSSRLATTSEVKDAQGRYKRRGGTLPPGHYACQYLPHHHTFGECIRLFRRADAIAIHTPFYPHPIPHGRGNDFFIHGSGPKGSDGCIVPAIEAERFRLNRAVKQFPGEVVIEVKNVSYQLPPELEHQIA